MTRFCERKNCQINVRAFLQCDIKYWDFYTSDNIYIHPIMNVKWNLVDLSSFLECNLWWFSMRLHFHIFLVCCSQNDYQWLGKRWRKWDLRDPIKPSTNLECKITVNDESHWSRFQFKRISTFRLTLVPSIAQLSSEHPFSGDRDNGCEHGAGDQWELSFQPAEHGNCSGGDQPGGEGGGSGRPHRKPSPSTPANLSHGAAFLAFFSPLFKL